MRIGSRGLPLDQVESVNWRGVATIAVVSAVNGVLYATGAVAVPFVTTAPMTAALYVGLSWLARDRVRAREAARRAAAGASLGHAVGEPPFLLGHATPKRLGALGAGGGLHEGSLPAFFARVP